MKRFTRITSFVMALTLALLCVLTFPTEANAATEGYYTYEVSDGAATITGCDEEISGDIILPDTLGGYPVTTIGDRAFAHCYSLNSLTIPNSVTTIGSYAFYYCDRLTSINVPEGVTAISDFAFYGCYSLTSITIPNSVTTIGSYAFYDCDSLTSITIPKNVTAIGYWAFHDCSSLNEISVDKNNKNYSSDEHGVLFNKNKTELIQAPRAIAGAYTIPDSVTTISDEAFYGCENLTSIDIPNSVTTIGKYAFACCYSLTGITIPESVTTIGFGVFSSCSSLTEISVDKNNKNLSNDESGVLFNKDKTELIQAPGAIAGAYTIPDSVITIGDWAFEFCESLTSITIPNSVTTIGVNAFYECGSLTSVSIPDSVVTICEDAFFRCDSLNYNTYDNGKYLGNSQNPYLAFIEPISVDITSCQIHANTKILSVGAFEYCSSLTSITIPDSVTTIGYQAFYSCDSLNYNIYDNGKYLGNSQNPYLAFIEPISVDITSCQIHANTKILSVGAFEYCSSLTSITIPEGVTTISDGAFEYCSSLTSITIPNSVTIIGDNAFRYCHSLTSITIPNSVTTIGDSAFMYCYSLETVTYCGTQAQWDAIEIGYSNKCLTEATLQFHDYQSGICTICGGSKPITIEKLKAPTLTKDGEILTWEAVAYADAYEVYRATSKSGKYTKVATITETTWQDAAAAGKTYYYKVKAILTGDSSKNSDLSSAVSIDYKCEAPVITVENGSTGKPVISWEKIAGASKYTVYRATSENGKYSKLKTVKTLSYTDTKAKAGTTYFYKVIANASSSKYNSGYSNIVSCGVICGTPSVAVKIDAATGKPSLSWAKVEGATSYRILRQLPGEETFTELKIQTGITFADTTAPIDTVCQYQVQALGATEELNGAVSKTVTATSGIARPAMKATVDAVSGKPTLTWEAVEGAVKYEIYRSTKSTKGYTLLATVETTSYADESVAAGKTYYYKMVAIGEVGKSAETAYVKLTGKCAVPTITVENGPTGKPVISWEKVEGAKKYTVYRATSENGKYTKLKAVKTLSYTDTKAAVGTTYYYKVVANASSSKNSSGYSNFKKATAICAAPAVKLTVASSGKPVLSWAKVTGAVKYEVYLLGGEDYVVLGTVTGTSFTDETCMPGEGRYYGVRAIAEKEGYNSEVSEPILGRGAHATPKATGKVGATGKPEITWGEVEGATRYVIYRSTSKTKNFKTIGESETLSYTDTTASKGKTYYYKVVAISQDAESAQSDAVKVKSK